MSVLECMCILWIQVCLSKSRKTEIISVPCEMISSIAVINIDIKTRFTLEEIVPDS